MHRCTVDNLCDITIQSYIYMYTFLRKFFTWIMESIHTQILGISNVVGISRFLVYNLKS